MSLAHAIANGLMHAAAVLAPKRRADWAQAMRAELAAVEGGSAALGWAAGCLTTALGWRLRAEAFWLMGLAGAYVLAARAVGYAWFALMDWLPDAPEHLLPFVAQGIVVGIPSLLLCTRRPGWAPLVMAVLVLPGFYMPVMGAIPGMLAHPFETAGNEPPVQNWVMALIFVGMFVWPAVVGGGLGWLIGRLARRRT